MLLQKPVTKRQKKEVSKKRLGLNLVFVGLALIALSLFFTAYLEKPPKILTPLAKNQTSEELKIVKILKDKDISYKTVETNPDLSKNIKLKSGAEVIIDSKKDINVQLSSLQLILSQLKIEGKTFKRLDFRYQKPVITF